MIPQCPRPTEAELVALENAVRIWPDLGDLERRRIVHCCQLDVLADTEDGKRCQAIIAELEAEQ